MGCSNPRSALERAGLPGEGWNPVPLPPPPPFDQTPGEAVYEPFTGSGTTLIAAETCGRIGFGVELDPVYVDVAVRRRQAFTGTCAVLEGSGRTFEAIAIERLAPATQQNDQPI